MKSEDLRYEADGLSMNGRLTYDETAAGARPGVAAVHGLAGAAVQAVHFPAGAQGYGAAGSRDERDIPAPRETAMAGAQCTAVTGLERA